MVRRRATKRSHKPNRDDRFHSPGESDDQRSRSQRDRDRLLYSASFRRLAGVTQVASPDEIDIFHNRLTHTLKVAQIGRRLAEKLLHEQEELATDLGGIDPEVVEAAALAHDLGHPPFGHVAEEILKQCVRNSGAGDGYEGNAQSFRIVTKLAFCRDKYPGLNLSRATLNAILKYPWLSHTEGKKEKKFGAYHSEEDEFRFARELSPGAEAKSVEAELMDWADDITYSVHDIEDFYQAGLIPLDRLVTNQDERTRFLDETEKRWRELGWEEGRNFGAYRDAFERLITLFPIDRPYAVAASQRDALKPMTSVLVGQFVRAISLQEPKKKGDRTVLIQKDKLIEVMILKQLTWHYVILSPALTTQQHGYKKIIKGLFEVYSNAISDGDTKLIPTWFRFDPKPAGRNNRTIARTAADIVSSLTDAQALKYYQRLSGIAPGSLRDWM